MQFKKTANLEVSDRLHPTEEGNSAPSDGTRSLRRGKALWLVLAAGVLAFAVFVLWAVLLGFLLERFQTGGMFEAGLLTDSFLKPVALVWFGLWVFLAGIFLKGPKTKAWGRRLLYIYAAVCVLPYVLSLAVTPNA